MMHHQGHTRHWSPSPPSPAPLIFHRAYHFIFPNSPFFFFPSEPTASSPPFFFLSRRLPVRLISDIFPLRALAPDAPEFCLTNPCAAGCGCAGGAMGGGPTAGTQCRKSRILLSGALA